MKYVFIDLDNTMIKYHSYEVSDDLRYLIKSLKEDFKIIVFSNSRRKRVENISKVLKVNFYYNSKKPFKTSFKKIISIFDKSKCVFIGDQFMTDVLGAKRNGLKVILVDRIDKDEPITTKFWRFLERHYLKKYQKKGVFKIHKYYDRLRSV